MKRYDLKPIVKSESCDCMNYCGDDTRIPHKVNPCIRRQLDQCIAKIRSEKYIVLMMNLNGIIKRTKNKVDKQTLICVRDKLKRLYRE